MKSWDGLALALLALLSNDATLTLAQYVTTVTVSVNSNPFCTSMTVIGASGFGSSGRHGGGAGGPGYGLGPGSSNGTGSSTGSATNGSSPITAINTTTGHYDALGYYLAPADGNLLGGPVSTSPFMTLELCGTTCQGYPYLALENGDECNCGSSTPSGAPSSSPPSKNKRQITSGGCIPCAGNSTECCGAPGGYALVYHVTSAVEGSSVAVYSTTSSAGSVVGASSTSYVAAASTSTYVNSTTNSGTTISYGPISTSSSASMYFSNTTNSTSSIIVATSAYYSNSSSGSTATTQTANGAANATAANGTPGKGSVATPMAENGGNGGAIGAGSGTTTINGGATATYNGGAAEPTVETPTPSCVSSANYAGNNTKYSDYFGYTYDIRCNLNLQSMATDSNAYAESFEDCLEYCSLLKDCVAVNYQDPPSTPNNLSNCFPKWNFGGYGASSGDGVYSGVNVNGASDGTLNDQDLCTTNNNQGSSYDGMIYYDDYGAGWTIGCNNTLAIPSAAALSTTITDTLATCVDYCSKYDLCDVVNWTGPHTNGTINDPNCFPASSNGTAGAAGSAPGSGYAILNPSD